MINVIINNTPVTENLYTQRINRHINVLMAHTTAYHVALI